MEFPQSKISKVESLFHKGDKSFLSGIPVDVAISYFIDEKAYSEFAEYKIKKLSAPNSFSSFMFRFSTEHFLEFSFKEDYKLHYDLLISIWEAPDFKIHQVDKSDPYYFLVTDSLIKETDGRRLICDYVISRYYLEDIDLYTKYFVLDEKSVFGFLIKFNTEGEFIVPKLKHINLKEKFKLAIDIFRKLECYHSSNLNYYDIDLRSIFITKGNQEILITNKKVSPKLESNAMDFQDKRDLKYKKCFENMIRTLYLIFEDRAIPLNYTTRLNYSESTYKFIEEIVQNIELGKELKKEYQSTFKKLLLENSRRIEYYDEVFTIMHLFYRIHKEFKEISPNEGKEDLDFEAKFEFKNELVKDKKVDADLPDQMEPVHVPEMPTIADAKKTCDKIVQVNVKQTKKELAQIQKHYNIVSTKFTILSESFKKIIDQKFDLKRVIDKTTIDKTHIEKTSTEKTIIDKTVVEKTITDKATKNYYELNESVIINNPVFVNLNGKNPYSLGSESFSFKILASKVPVQYNLEQLQKMIEDSNQLLEEADKEYTNNNFEAALKKYLLCIEYRVTAMGENKKETGVAFTGLGGVYMKMNNYKHALNAYLRAVSIYNSVLGEKHILLASVLHNIGLIYDLLNSYEKAMEYYNLALEIKIEHLGENSQSTATTYYNIGGIYDIMGNYPEAFRIYKKTLSIYNHVAGNINIDSATVYNNLGLLYDKQQKNEESIRHYNKSLEISIKILGENHPLVATSYNNIGLVYFKMNKLNEATHNLKKSIDIREGLFNLGFKTADNASSYNNLAGIYYKLGEYAKALAFYYKSLDASLTILNENAPETATAYNNIGLCKVKLKDFQKARECFQKAYDIRMKVFGENERETYSTLINLGGIAFKLKEYAVAIGYYSRALEAYKKIYSENSKELIPILSNLGHAYNNSSKLEEAFKCYNDNLEICLSKYGEKSHYTSDAYSYLSNYYESMGDLVKMKEYLMRSVVIKENLNYEKSKEKINTSNISISF